MQREHQWMVCLCRSDGKVTGCGVLVAPDLIVTCAHVVALATGHPPDGPPPGGYVTVLFPTVTSAGRYQARVVEDGWVPVAPNLTGDVALLRLDRPAQVPPAALAPCGPPGHRPVDVFGHPGGDTVGRWAQAHLGGPAGAEGEWLQLNDRAVPGPRIEGGFSGAGVIDRGSNTVIGLIVGADRLVEAKGAWMIDMEAVAVRLPVLGQYLPRRRQWPAADLRWPGLVDPTRADYEQALVDALEALDGIDQRTHRDELVAAVERLLDAPLGARRSDRTRTDLRYLVVACLDHQNGNALPRLVEVLRTFHGDVPAVRRLARLAVQDADRRLPVEDLRALVSLLAEVPVADVEAALRAALGPVSPAGDLAPEDLPAIIGTLAELTGEADRPPPLLMFLQYLVEPAGGPRTEALREWIGILSLRWGVPVEAALAKPAVAVPQRSYLVVELREDTPNPDRFLLSIWLQHDTGAGRALFVDDEQPLAIDEIVGHLGSQLRRVTNRMVGYIGTLTIEFVLPYVVISHPVDQFKVMLADGPAPIGSVYHVVIRSADRMRNHLIRHRWLTRWRWLLEHVDEPDPRAVRWVQPVATGRRADPGYPDEHPVCLIISMRSRNDNALREAIREGLEYGMPVLVWSRSRLPKVLDQFIVTMANQLNGRPLAELPTVMRQLRKEAALSRADDHLGAQLCLLWDDAGRPPPRNPLRAPS